MNSADATTLKHRRTVAEGGGPKVPRYAPRTLHKRNAISRRFQPVGEQAYGGSAGYLYSARSYLRTIKLSRKVAIYLSLNDEPIEFIVSNVRHEATAIAFKPMVPRTVMDHGAGFAVAMLNPTHANYRQFSTVSGEKMMILDRERFAPLDSAIRDASLGELSLQEGLQLLSRIVAIAAQDLPLPEPLDPRVAAVVNLLHLDANQSLAALAELAGLSASRLSHLFSSSIGLSLKSYRMWLKLDRSWRLIEQGYGIADIAKLAGFNDITHLCHVFQDAYGVSIAQQLRNLATKMSFSLA